MAITLIGAVALGDVDRADALTNCTVADTSIDSEEQAFLGLINAYRASNGLGTLSLSTNLSRAATWHGTDMATNRYFSHTDSLGRSPSTRATDCGYPSGAGENIAAGTVWDTAQEAFNAWKNSSGHNANMLNSYYRQIGIARVYLAGSPYTYYWVTDFGASDDGTGGALPTPTFTPTSAPPTPTPTPASGVTFAKATISSPQPGTTLPGASATFQWTTGAGAQEYFFYAGTSRGSNNIIGKSMGQNRSITVSNLPTTGQRIYVRLWTRSTTGWQYNDYTYWAATR